MLTIKQTSFGIFTLMASSVTLAGEASHDDHVQLNSHAHGEATLTMASEGSEIWLSLDSPAANLVGFEHQINTPEQQKVVDQVESLLMQGMVSFNGGNCQLVSSDLHSPFESDEHHEDEHHEDEHHEDEHHEDEHHEDEHHEDEHHEDEHHEDEHHEDEHHEDEHHEEEHHEGEHHGDEHHGDEHHEDEHHEAHGAEHSDYEVSWHYKCDDINALTGLSSSAFDQFSGMTNLNVEYLIENHQGAKTLTAQSSSVQF